MKDSIKREQSQAGLSFAERLRVLAGASEQVRAGEPCSGMRENRRSLAGGGKQFSTAGQKQIITSPRPAFDLIFNKNMAASSR